MNYLAHMVVGAQAGLDDLGVLGNFIGDAVKGRDVEAQWGPAVSLGIRLHRSIDDVSDLHAASKEARTLLRHNCGKWSGVVWDVLVDHVLASEFRMLHGLEPSLEVFCEEQQGVLDRSRHLMPERSQRFFDAMVEHGWLVGYRDGETVDAVLQAMSRRRESAGPVACGWKAFCREEEALREMARALIQAMMQWGQGQNTLPLTSPHLQAMRSASI